MDSRLPHDPAPFVEILADLLIHPLGGIDRIVVALLLHLCADIPDLHDAGEFPVQTLDPGRGVPAGARIPYQMPTS